MTLRLVFLLALELALLGILALLIGYNLFQFYATARGAPYVPSRPSAMDDIIQLAALNHGARLLELGSGNGELCIRAAERGALATGIEINPLLVAWSRHRARRRGVAARVTILRHDFWTMTLPRDTDVVLLYLLPKTMQKLWPKLCAELPPGTRIFSNAFRFRGVAPTYEKKNIALYVLPDPV